MTCLKSTVKTVEYDLNDECSLVKVQSEENV